MTETLKSVATAGTGEINWMLIGVVGVLFVLIAGWYFLIHKRGNDAQAKVVAAEVGSTVVADLTAALTKAHGIIDNLTALLAEHIDPTKPKVDAGTVTTPSARAELNEWADGTWPAGHVPADSGTALAHEVPTLHRDVPASTAPWATTQQRVYLAMAFDPAQSPETRKAYLQQLMTSLGFPGSDAAEGTPANAALAKFLRENPR